MPIKSVSSGVQIVLITSTISGAILTSTGVTPGTGIGQLMVKDQGAYTFGGGTVDLENFAPTPIEASESKSVAVPILRNAEEIGIILPSFDLSGILDFDASSTGPRLLGFTSPSRHARSKSLSEWIKLLAGYVGSQNQSIGHDEDAEPGWQEDVECETNNQ